MSESVAAPPAASPPWWKTSEGSAGRLGQLCLAYFTFYSIFTVAAKCMTGPQAVVTPVMNDVAFLVYTTLGGSAICLTWVFLRGWYRLKSTRLMTWGGVTFPSEFVYIIPSGFCTAVVIPTTTMMYMLPITVMVAMVIMRATVIVISRVVDAIQIRQGILHRRVYIQEEVAVAFAIAAVATQLLSATKKPGSFDFLHNPLAMAILGAYIVAYMFRIYIMNYFKNTRGKGVPQDNNGFFAVEQMSASVVMAGVALVVFFSPYLFGIGAPGGASASAGDAASFTFRGWYQQWVVSFREAILDPRPLWGWAILIGMVYGLVAFVSVFIFMFKGRTATFAGLVNRLTSLVAGTASTVAFWKIFGGKAPKGEDWVSLGLIIVAVGFLTIAERRRSRELAAQETAKA